MIFGSLDDVFGHKRRILNALEDLIRPLSIPQLAFRPAAEAWTICEIVEHLVLVESRLIRFVNISVQKAERSTPVGTSIPPFAASIRDGIERNDYHQVRTRSEFEPSGKVPVSESLQRLQEIQQQLFGLRPTLERVDLTKIRFDHWLLGPMPLNEWVPFIGVHEERHLDQVRALIATPTFRDMSP